MSSLFGTSRNIAEQQEARLAALSTQPVWLLPRLREISYVAASTINQWQFTTFGLPANPPISLLGLTHQA